MIRILSAFEAVGINKQKIKKKRKG